MGRKKKGTTIAYEARDPHDVPNPFEYKAVKRAPAPKVDKPEPFSTWNAAPRMVEAVEPLRKTLSDEEMFIRAHMTRTGTFHCWALRGHGDLPAELKTRRPKEEDGWWETVQVTPLGQPTKYSRDVFLAWEGTKYQVRAHLMFGWPMDSFIRNLLKQEG